MWCCVACYFKICDSFNCCYLKKQGFRYKYNGEFLLRTPENFSEKGVDYYKTRAFVYY